MRSVELRRVRAGAVTSLAALWLACCGGDSARAQVLPQANETGGAISLGGRGWSDSQGKPPTSD
ncbi:MAG TPA: hypothetical protein VFP79_09945, partial [Pseudolabrys sp.]|nr:hypothetical protein [Pseudolabrys sp.]